MLLSPGVKSMTTGVVSFLFTEYRVKNLKKDYKSIV